MSRSRNQKRGKGILGWGLRLCLTALLILFLFTVIEVGVLRFVNPPCTVFSAWSWLRGKMASRPYRSPQFQWRPMEGVSPYLIQAVMAGEDQRFLSHHGFDFIELNEAVRDLLTERRVRGASTITMQVARTVFLWPERSWLRKATEAYYTMLIELLWSKKRILEIYVNTVDWGTGIMGIEAASRKYFRKGSDRITRIEAAALAAMLPSPHLWSPSSPSKQYKERLRRILKDMETMPSL